MTYEYNPYTLAMYSDSNSITDNSDHKYNKEEEQLTDGNKEGKISENKSHEPSIRSKLEGLGN